MKTTQTVPQIEHTVIQAQLWGCGCADAPTAFAGAPQGSMYTVIEVRSCLFRALGAD